MWQMFGIIKESYKFLFLNFPKVLWIISGLLFLELSLRFLLIRFYGSVWLGWALATIEIIILFTKIYVIIDLTRLVVADRAILPKNPVLIYIKVLGAFLLIGTIKYVMGVLLEHLPFNTMFSSSYVAIVQFFLVIFVFNCINAILNPMISSIVMGKGVFFWIKVKKGRYLNWLMVSVMVYLPFMIFGTVSMVSYFFIIAKVLFFSLVYIFSAFVIKEKLDT